jgi:hypothetical protein
LVLVHCAERPHAAAAAQAQGTLGMTDFEIDMLLLLAVIAFGAVSFAAAIKWGRRRP